MSLLSKLERLVGATKKRKSSKSKPRRKAATKKRQPKALREYWAKKRKRKG